MTLTGHSASCTYSRARSIKTRIETYTALPIFLFARFIREQDPLKQGLKRHTLCIITRSLGYSRARSIKTRIETITYRLYASVLHSIREQDPLKQGLKPTGLDSTTEALSGFASKIH